jgi:hypothetical protein
MSSWVSIRVHVTSLTCLRGARSRGFWAIEKTEFETGFCWRSEVCVTEHPFWLARTLFGGGFPDYARRVTTSVLIHSAGFDRIESRPNALLL